MEAIYGQRETSNCIKQTNQSFICSLIYRFAVPPHVVVSPQFTFPDSLLLAHTQSCSPSHSPILIFSDRHKFTCHFLSVIMPVWLPIFIPINQQQHRHDTALCLLSICFTACVLLFLGAAFSLVTVLSRELFCCCATVRSSGAKRTKSWLLRFRHLAKAISV